MNHVSITEIERAIERLTHPMGIEFVANWCRANIGHCSMVISLYTTLALALRTLHQSAPKRMTVVEWRKVQAEMVRNMGPQYAGKFTLTPEGDTIKVFLHSLEGVDREPSVQTDWAARRGGTQIVPAFIDYRNNKTLGIWPTTTSARHPINENLLAYCDESLKNAEYWQERREKFVKALRVAFQDSLADDLQLLIGSMRRINDNPLSEIGDRGFDEIFRPIDSRS